MVENSKIFAERLRELRGKVPQGKLGGLLGVSRGSVSFYENEERTPDADFIIKAARYFGVTTDYLLGLSDYKLKENTEIAQHISLSDSALDFLKECPPELRNTLDKFLSNQDTQDFFLELMTYVYALSSARKSEAVEIISYQLTQMSGSKVPPVFTQELIQGLQWRNVERVLKNISESIAKPYKEAANNGND